MCQCVGVGGAQYRALCLALDEQCIQVGTQYADCWSLPGPTLLVKVEVHGQGLEPTPVNGKPIRPSCPTAPCGTGLYSTRERWHQEAFLRCYHRGLDLRTSEARNPDTIPYGLASWIQRSCWRYDDTVTHQRRQNVTKGRERT